MIDLKGIGGVAALSGFGISEFTAALGFFPDEKLLGGGEGLSTE